MLYSVLGVSDVSTHNTLEQRLLPHSLSCALSSRAGLTKGPFNRNRAWGRLQSRKENFSSEWLIALPLLPFQTPVPRLSLLLSLPLPFFPFPFPPLLFPPLPISIPHLSLDLSSSLPNPFPCRFNGVLGVYNRRKKLEIAAHR
jgi:hypothetical protein